MGFFQKLKEQMQAETAKANAKVVERKEKAELEEQRKAEMDAEGTPYCPKCSSTALSADKKGFGLGKALVGGVLLGPVGLLGGAIGRNKIQLFCMKCGHKFKA